ncbi:MAG: sugar phosphate nucleotidyltransferase [Steroidobacteraceae bacterium]
MRSDYDDHVWALVLAGGDGNRLRSLTTTASGVAVPKQYCSLHGETTLLHSALDRAQAITAKHRICTIVAAQHRQWWEMLLSEYAAEHIVVQPRNCGTAIGIMLSLLHIVRHDPDAQILLLPSDHHVHEEAILTEALQRASARLGKGCDKVLVLGIEPEEADSELGYVLPGKYLGEGVFAVASFIEKPPVTRAHQLLAQGALWNTFIVAATATTLLQLFAQRCPEILAEMQAIVNRSHEAPPRRGLLDELYTRLPSLDFSRHVLQGVESLLEVLSVPACGWSDLGTPRRIRDVLHRWPQTTATSSRSVAPVTLAAHADFIVSKSLYQTS